MAACLIFYAFSQKEKPHGDILSAKGETIMEEATWKGRKIAKPIE
jgi:hypothetical protein